MKKCPYCAEEIQDEAIKCKHCGEMLVKNPKTRFCHRCGAENSLDAFRCKNDDCAEVFLHKTGTVQSQIPIQAAQKKRKTTWVWWGIAFVFLICVLTKEDGSSLNPSSPSPSSTAFNESGQGKVALGDKYPNSFALMDDLRGFWNEKETGWDKERLKKFLNSDVYNGDQIYREGFKGTITGLKLNLVGACFKEVQNYQGSSPNCDVLENMLNDDNYLNSTIPKVSTSNKKVDTAITQFDDKNKEIFELNKAIQENPNEETAYAERGLYYLRRGQYDDAIRDYSRAIEIDPQYAEAYYNKAFAYNNKGNYDQSILDYTKAIEINPNFSEAYNNRGTAYRSKGDIDKAISDYTRSIEINPREYMSYFNRGIVYDKKNKRDDAISDFTKAIEIKPDYAEAYLNRGAFYEDKGYYKEAISDLNRAIEINPLYAEAYNILGNIYFDMDRYDEAISEYTKAIKINPNFSQPYFSRASLYSHKNEFAKALEDGEKAKMLGYKVDPNFLDRLKRALNN